MGLVKPILICLFMHTIYLSLNAQETVMQDTDGPMVLNSTEAQYDGKEITLMGQVVLQHGIGQISAQRLAIKPSLDKEKKQKFTFLRISDNVEIELQEGGKLSCQKAEVDYAKLQGLFWGNEEAPDVIYQSQEQMTSVPSPLLIIKSKHMTLDLERQQTESKSAKILVKQVQAYPEVRIHYNQNYLLLADRAIYDCLPHPSFSIQQGLLTLWADDNCVLTTLNGDYIHAKKIKVHTAERTLWLDQPKGLLLTGQKEKTPQQLEFIAQELLWNDQTRQLQLKKQIKLTQNHTFHLTTDEEVSLIQAADKKTIRLIQAPQHIEISYQDEEKNRNRKMYCPGPIVIDHEQQEMILKGDENQQVYIEDLAGEMYADRISVNYAWQEKQLVPTKIVLEGHVRLMSRFDGHLQESGSILHYALADQIDYLPQAQEMILKSTTGNRVLFFDKVNNVQMSSPSLKVCRDAQTGKEIIQGLGDVRFTFMEQELKQLKQRFPFEAPSQKGIEDVVK